MVNDDGAREWGVEEEIKLFNLICDHKPAGRNKQEHIVLIVDSINEGLAKHIKPFTIREVWAKLGTLYNLERVDYLENYGEESVDSISDTKTVDTKENIPETATESPRTKVEPDEKDDKKHSRKNRGKKHKSRGDDDSSGLSDVETNVKPTAQEEEKIPEKLDVGGNEEEHGDQEENDNEHDDSDHENDNELEKPHADRAGEEDENDEDEANEPKRKTRVRKVAVAPKKRTRSSPAEDLPPVKRKQSKVSISPLPSARRRTRSDKVEEPEKKVEKKDEKANRKTRSAPTAQPRRSSRHKPQ